MDKLIDLCILFGGKSTEYEVSLLSAYGVLTNADHEKYRITTVGITRDGKWLLYEGENEAIRDDKWDDGALSPVTVALDGTKSLILQNSGEHIPVDVVFPLLHGRFGEDGTVQGMLALAGIPVVGGGAADFGGGCAANAVCMDKSLTKAVAAFAGVPQARSLSFTDLDVEEDTGAVVAEIEREIGYPAFIKPANAGSSVGVTKAKDRSSLVYGLALATSFDKRAVVEEYVSGAEVEIALTGIQGDMTVSAPGEIEPGAEFYDYDTKYNNDTAQYHIPARISETAAAKVRDYAVRVYKAAGCGGLARADFFVDGEKVVFNEINTIPGFTPISMFAKLYCHTERKTYSQLIDRLVGLALG